MQTLFTSGFCSIVVIVTSL